jgi:hypothetical protein
MARKKPFYSFYKSEATQSEATQTEATQKSWVASDFAYLLSFDLFKVLDESYQNIHVYYLYTKYSKFFQSIEPILPRLSKILLITIWLDFP